MLLNEWGLVKIVSKHSSVDVSEVLSRIKIIPYKEKDNWILEPKYNIGKKRS